jgi:hypothetical protein
MARTQYESAGLFFLNLLLRADYSDPNDIRFKNKIELCVADFLEGFASF